MKKGRTGNLILACMLVATAVFSVSTVQAQPAVVLSPEGSKTIEFYIHDVFDSEDFGPMQGFVVIANGFFTPAGELEIVLKVNPERDFMAVMHYSLIGVGFTLDPTAPLAFLSASGEVPGSKIGTSYGVSTVVPVNSQLGIFIVGVKVDSIDSAGVDLPIPFSIAFSLSAGEAAE